MDAPANRLTLVATNRPWMWKIGSACSSTSLSRELPHVFQRLRIGNEIAMRQHGALGTPGGAGGVENGGQIIHSPTSASAKCGGLPFCFLDQRAAVAVIAQGQDSAAGT